MTIAEKTFTLAGPVLAGDPPETRLVVAGKEVFLPGGLFQFDLTVPDPDCGVHLQRLDGRWWDVLGYLPPAPEHGDPRGPRTFRPEPIQLPACMVRLDAPDRFSTGISATLTLIG
jgi:hypothetical protein